MNQILNTVTQMTLKEQLAVLKVFETGLEAGLMTRAVFQSLADIDFADNANFWKACAEKEMHGNNFMAELHPEFEPGTAAILMVGASGGAKATAVIKKAAEYLTTILISKSEA